MTPDTLIQTSVGLRKIDDLPNTFTGLCYSNKVEAFGFEPYFCRNVVKLTLKNGLTLVCDEMAQVLVKGKFLPVRFLTSDDPISLSLPENAEFGNNSEWEFGRGQAYGAIEVPLDYELIKESPSSFLKGYIAGLMYMYARKDNNYGLKLTYWNFANEFSLLQQVFMMFGAQAFIKVNNGYSYLHVEKNGFGLLHDILDEGTKLRDAIEEELERKAGTITKTADACTSLKSIEALPGQTLYQIKTRPFNFIAMNGIVVGTEG